MSDSIIDSLKNKVIEGNLITKEEAKELLSAPIDELCAAANEIREHFCGNGFDLCSITNAKCGKCSEDCKFCAQSAHYDTAVTYYSLKSGDEMTEEAVHNENQGILRFSLVTSGRSLSPKEIDSVCDSIREIKSKSMIEICVSIGIPMSIRSENSLMQVPPVFTAIWRHRRGSSLQFVLLIPTRIRSEHSRLQELQA